MKAYGYPGLSKSDFLAELALHAEQDRIVQGIYWNDDDGRGCAVGCSLHSASVRLGIEMAFNSHANYETYLGIPQILARIEDRIFEGLRPEEARKWPQRFAAAIPAGADLSNVWNRFALWLLREIAPFCAKTDKTRAAINTVIKGFETNWATVKPQDARTQARAAAADAYAAHAASAAYAAAYAAASAASAAAYATYDAAHAAYAASLAAAAAAHAHVAYAAAAAAAPAAAHALSCSDVEYDAYLRMSDQLCIFLSEAPVTENPDG
jgi:hypothetical protein